MIYERDTMPDGTVYERYEGSPEDILELKSFKIDESIIKGYQLDEEGIEQLRRTGTVRTDRPIKMKEYDSDCNNTLNEILNILKYYMKKIGILYKEEF